jgi:hypothetical protein
LKSRLKTIYELNTYQLIFKANFLIEIRNSNLFIQITVNLSNNLFELQIALNRKLRNFLVPVLSFIVSITSSLSNFISAKSNESNSKFIQYNLVNNILIAFKI